MAHMKVGEKRKYVIPLRKSWMNIPRWRRSKRAIDDLQDFIQKHTKVHNVRISRWLNQEIWKHGGKNPPAKVEVEVKIENRKVQDKKTKKDIDVPFAVAELAALPKRAERVAKKAEEKAKKFKIEKKPEAKAEGETLKEKVAKKMKKKEEAPAKEKKKSKKELAEELHKEEQKKTARVTKAQEMQMKK